jgi:hypothetical protein
LKVVLEIVTVVLTFVVVGGCGVANWFTYDSMIVDLNRGLPSDKKIPIIFAQLNPRHWAHDVLREHREQFPASKLYRRFFVFLALQGVALGLFMWELASFKPFRIFH